MWNLVMDRLLLTCIGEQHVKARRSTGFTLIEVLVALVILSITFVWLLKAESQGIDMALRSRFITTSTILAEGHISNLRLEPVPASGTEETGDFGDDYPGYTYEERWESTTIEGYLKYTLVIRFGGGKNGFENTFITFLASK